MPSIKKPEFVLLSRLIHRLENQDYYRVFAKTVAMTANPAYPIPADNELVSEMFQFYIREKALKIYYNESIVSTEFIESEIHRRTSENYNSDESFESYKQVEKKLIWEQEIYTKISDLKKLYANKCIVLPNSLLADIA